jgi:hypothetical protein
MPLYKHLHHLLNVFVEIANIMGLQNSDQLLVTVNVVPNSLILVTLMM